MTRPAIRLAIDALEGYKPGLLPEDQQVAEAAISELHRAIMSANRDNRRRAARHRPADGGG